ncbi:hypothetical protein ABEV34_27230 [Methylorubrum rhodesianum]|uniref:hypothetical protein n=1 Tax=Methylorubrum TaxID=2282523 RepID=UPI00129CD867|nr:MULTISPECIES: hypothetical protein [Methylorubrum]MBB5765664.1 hypothetical protein [Methylorubrum rhodesianum]MBI1691563.1 hypothetical protein [Methylorubrum sp. DB1722]MRI57391.1 hypothetical protein [Methylobacterium sp. DB1607]
MLWILRNFGREIFRGSYQGAIETAERMLACERSFHADGTERTPRLERGFSLVPARSRASERAAA